MNPKNEKPVYDEAMAEIIGVGFIADDQTPVVVLEDGRELRGESEGAPFTLEETADGCYRMSY